MFLLARIAEGAQTEVGFGYGGKEYAKPGLLQELSQYVLIYSIGGSIGALLGLLSAGELMFIPPIVQLGFLLSVIVEVVLVATRPRIQQNLSWELKNWVTRHQWMHGTSILLSGALLLHLLFN